MRGREQGTLTRVALPGSPFPGERDGELVGVVLIGRHCFRRSKFFEISTNFRNFEKFRSVSKISNSFETNFETHSRNKISNYFVSKIATETKSAISNYFATPWWRVRPYFDHFTMKFKAKLDNLKLFRCDVMWSPLVRGVEITKCWKWVFTTLSSLTSKAIVEYAETYDWKIWHTVRQNS